MIIAGIADAETGGNIANLLFSLTLIFCGVLQTAKALPGFWIFMYRVSPFTYLVEGMLSTAIANTKVHCAANEFVPLNPPSGQTCGQYLKPYTDRGSYLKDPSATGTCEFCAYQESNTFLGLIGLNYANAWRDFGILWAFILFNIFAAVGIYWLARVPKKSKHRKAEEKTAKEQEKAA
jgi:ABC-type multidrug transport system permease subunit